MILGLFTVPVYKTTLTIDNTKLAHYCKSLSKADKDGRVISNIGGWQSKAFVAPFNNAFKSLVDNIEKHVHIYNKSVNLTTKSKIDNLWVNINGYKDVNELHNHPSAIYSGVYYVNTPKDCGNILFHHPGNVSMGYDWGNKQVEFNRFNSSSWWLPSEAKTLYIFPSWLQHMVRPNLNKTQKRISISFNVH